MTTVFLSFIGDILRANIALAGDFKIMLVSEAYTPDDTGHTRRSDITNEVSGDGYTAGGVAIIPEVIDDVANSRIKIRFPQTTFSNVTVGARGCVIYRARGGAASADELVCYGDLGETVDVEAGDFVIEETDLNVSFGG